MRPRASKVTNEQLGARATLAIVLSAGVGERLLPVTRERPKCLIEIAGGKSLLELQLETFARSGVERVVLVTGYLTEQIEAAVSDVQEPRVTIQYNPFFADSNNLVSAWMARSNMDEDFVLMNGDDLVKSTVIQALLRDPSDGVCMVVARKPVYDAEDMKVVLDGDRILRVGKTLDSSEANGESIGLIRFSGEGRALFSNVLDRMVRQPPKRHLFYLAAIQKLIDAGVSVSYNECSPADWAEIDFHPDIDLIRERIRRESESAHEWE